MVISDIWTGRLNRSYDNQTYIRIHLEVEAKLYIQDMAKRVVWRLEVDE